MFLHAIILGVLSWLSPHIKNDASGRALTHDVVFSGADFVLLRIPEATKQKVVHISILAQEVGEEGAMGSRAMTYKFSTLTENVDTNAALPTEFTEPECVLLDMRCDLELLKVDKQKQQETMQTNRDVIASAQVKIDSLKEKQQIQTPDEITDSNSQITQLQGTIAAAEKEIAKLQDDLFRLAGQKKNKLEKIEEYRLRHGM